MKNKLYLFLVTLILFTSCEDNIIQSEKKEYPPKVKEIIEKKELKVKKTKTLEPYNLSFISINKEQTKLEIKKGIYNFSNILQPIVLVNFFSTWCPPCRGQMPHLNNLQKIYRDKLFIIGIVLHDEMENIDKKVKNCITLKTVNYFISSSQKSNNKLAKIVASKLKLKADFELPLMVMYVYGEYYTHYEGTVPQEMIESDIKQALNDIEG